MRMNETVIYDHVPFVHPNNQKSALLEHLGRNINPLCKFNIDNVNVLDIIMCSSDFKLNWRYMENTVTGLKT